MSGIWKHVAFSWIVLISSNMSNVSDYFPLKNELKPSVEDYLAAGVGAKLFN